MADAQARMDGLIQQMEAIEGKPKPAPSAERIFHVKVKSTKMMSVTAIKVEQEGLNAEEVPLDINTNTIISVIRDTPFRFVITGTNGTQISAPPSPLPAPAQIEEVVPEPAAIIEEVAEVPAEVPAELEAEVVGGASIEEASDPDDTPLPEPPSEDTVVAELQFGNDPAVAEIELAAEPVVPSVEAPVVAIEEENVEEAHAGGEGVVVSMVTLVLEESALPMGSEGEWRYTNESKTVGLELIVREENTDPGGDELKAVQNMLAAQFDDAQMAQIAAQEQIDAEQRAIQAIQDEEQRAAQAEIEAQAQAQIEAQAQAVKEEEGKRAKEVVAKPVKETKIVEKPRRTSSTTATKTGMRRKSGAGRGTGGAATKKVVLQPAPPSRLSTAWATSVLVLSATQELLWRLKNPIIFAASVAVFALKGDELAV